MDIVTTEDIYKLSLYKNALVSAPEEGSRELEELSRKTECGQNRETSSRAVRRHLGKGRTVRGAHKRFSLPVKGRRQQINEDVSAGSGAYRSGQSSPGVGVTHFTVLLGNYMTGVMGRKTAVLEWNTSELSGKYRKFIRQELSQTDKIRRLLPMESLYYKNAGRKELLECQLRFDTVILDFGTYNGKVEEELLRCDRKFFSGFLQRVETESLFGAYIRQTGKGLRLGIFCGFLGIRRLRV